MANLISVEIIATKILVIRGKRVMLDSDLAKLYGVTVKRLNEQVKRNRKRFPDDFAYQLTRQEVINLKSQNATSSWGGVRKLPYVELVANCDQFKFEVTDCDLKRRRKRRLFSL
jgi:hypothetical protein